MIQYTGKATESDAQIIVFGDGIANSLTIPMSKAPFNLTFSNNAPVDVVVFTYAETATRIRSAKFISGELILTFEEPPPATNFDPFSGSVGVPRTRVDLYFLYETPPITK